jgi:hypothetical protein
MLIAPQQATTQLAYYFEYLADGSFLDLLGVL